MSGLMFHAPTGKFVVDRDLQLRAAALGIDLGAEWGNELDLRKVR